jgi:hypothetical protein
VPCPLGRKGDPEGGLNETETRQRSIKNGAFSGAVFARSLGAAFHLVNAIAVADVIGLDHRIEVAGSVEKVKPSTLLGSFSKSGSTKNLDGLCKV